MELISWTDDLIVGNKDIDDDHRGLFDLLERLHRDMEVGTINQETQAIVDALRNYTETHFSREEALMRSISYADYAKHKAEHDKFIDEVCDLQSLLARGAQNPQTAIDRSLTSWLRTHVLVMDTALAAKLAEQTVA